MPQAGPWGGCGEDAAAGQGEALLGISPALPTAREAADLQTLQAMTQDAFSARTVAIL
jgi:hypothetical protein